MEKKISAGTISRFVVLFIALVNTALNMSGVQTIPVNDEQVAIFINMAFLGGASLVGWWKNNDVTKKARAKSNN